MEKESETHLSVSRASTVDSTTSTNTSSTLNSSFEDAVFDTTDDGYAEVRGHRSPQVQGSPARFRATAVELKETRIVISRDEGCEVEGEGEGENDEESKKRSESLHKLHQQHALDSWDQEGDSASSSSRSSSTTRVSPRLSPSPSHRVPQLPSTHSSSPTHNLNNFLSLMCLGSTVLKIKRQGKASSKMLYLDNSRTYIRWKPSKKGHKARVNINSIREIREGAHTDTFKRHLASTGHQPAHCFSVIHGTSWESLDIVASSLEEAQSWIRGLRHLLERAQEETEKSDQLRDSWLRSVFESADKSGDGLLSMDEVLKLLHKLNVNLSKRKVKLLFKEADTNVDEHMGKLDFDEFVHFYKTLSMRPELWALLREYSCGKEHMDMDDLELFLGNEQGIPRPDEQKCRDLIAKYEPVPENIENNRLGIDGLMRYVLSEEGDLFEHGHREVNQDMTRPLSEYYIASSHNTYLLGDQLMSQSSVDVYGLVLQAGCRCVELDCWDGKDGEPVIYHGYTLTSKVKFRDVITVVDKYAFVSSPYPVILSIENHCTLEQQKKMAKYLLEILGDQLILDSPVFESEGLPSPESLKRKILIKAKKLPLDHDAELEAGEVSEEDSADELDEDFKLEKSETRSKFESIAMAQLALMKKKPISPSQQAWQRIAHKRLDRLKSMLEEVEVKERNTANKSSKNGRSGLSGTFRKLKPTRRRARMQHSSESENSSMEYDRSSSRDDDLEGTNDNQQEGKKQRPGSTNRKKSFVLSRQLSDLVKYTRSVAFKGFPENMPWWELPSLGEMRASNLAATRAKEFAAFTTHNLCRVYPSAYRIDSSNFNPQPMWNCGCQLVALNYQTEGRSMQLLRAKFRANGNTGYVLKPKILRQDGTPFDPSNPSSALDVQRKQLTIHVISGQQLPKPPQSLLGERGEIIDPYVEVEVVGLPRDCTKAQTKTVQDNGFNPVWDCIMTFPISLPELTLVRFVVWDEDPIGRDFIGQATFPFSSVAQGYRHIHLEGLDHATIFVHITIEDLTDKKYVKNSRSLRSTSITRVSTASPSRHRTKSIDNEVNLLSGSPVHHQSSPRRRPSLAERLGIRRRHSTTTLLVENIMTVAGRVGTSGGTHSPTSPTAATPPTFGMLRQKRRSYEGEMRKTRSQNDEPDSADDVFAEDKDDLYPVDSESVIELISSCGDTAELEADGSVSIPLDSIPQILRLGLSPSMLLHVIQERRLSLRASPSSDSLSSADFWDSREGRAMSGCESDYDDDFTYPVFVPTEPPALSEGSAILSNNDMSVEIEAIMSARFPPDKLLQDDGESLDDCQSTEMSFSSLGSTDDISITELKEELSRGRGEDPNSPSHSLTQVILPPQVHNKLPVEGQAPTSASLQVQQDMTRDDRKDGKATCSRGSHSSLNEKQVDAVDIPKEADTKSTDHTEEETRRQDVAEASSSHWSEPDENDMGSLNYVVDSLLDLAASLAKEEEEIRASMKIEQASSSKSEGEEEVGRKMPNHGVLHHQVEICQSKDTFPAAVSKPEDETAKNSCHTPASSDTSSRIPTGALPTAVNGCQNSIQQAKNEIQKASPRTQSKPKTFARSFSGLFQKHDLFVSKQSEANSKGGLRSSLKKRFTTRSVPDITKVDVLTKGQQEDGQGERDSTTELSRSIQSLETAISQPTTKNSSQKTVKRTFKVQINMECSKNSVLSESDSTDVPITCTGKSQEESSPVAVISSDVDVREELPQESIITILQDTDQETECIDTIEKSTQTEERTDMRQVVECSEDTSNSHSHSTWHREGNLTRPLSCPVLPQETTKNQGKCRIVYIHDQPLDKVEEPLSSNEYINSAIDDGVEILANAQVDSNNEASSGIEPVLQQAPPEGNNLEGAGSRGSGDGFGTHICIVKGCDCGFQSLSQLLDSSLLTETCFMGDDQEETGEDAEIANGMENIPDITDRNEQTVEKEADVQSPTTLESSREHVASSKIMLSNPRENEAVSTLNSDLKTTRRSISKFRSEYNRSFDEEDSDGEGKSALHVNGSVQCDLGVQNIQTVEISPETLYRGAAESVGSTESSNPGSGSIKTSQHQTIHGKRANVDVVAGLESSASIAMLEQAENSDRSSDSDKVFLQECTTSEEDAVDSDSQLPRGRVTEVTDEGITNESRSVEEGLTESGATAEKPFDMLKSLEEVTSLLDNELSQRRNLRRNSSPGSLLQIPHSFSNRQVDASMTQKMAITKSKPEIGGAISVRFLSRIPRSHMSAYAYSDSDSDYDSTTSGSSQDTVVDAIARHPRGLKCKPPVPPKTSTLALSASGPECSSQPAKKKPPVPPKPRHLRNLLTQNKPRDGITLSHLTLSEGGKSSPLAGTCNTNNNRSALQEGCAIPLEITLPEPSFLRISNLKAQDAGKMKEQKTISPSTSSLAPPASEDVLDSSSREGHVTQAISSTGRSDPAEATEQTNKGRPSNESNARCQNSETGVVGEGDVSKEMAGTAFHVTMRVKTGRRPPKLQHRHSTGSLFAMNGEAASEDFSNQIISVNRESYLDRVSHGGWDCSMKSSTLGRKRHQSQRVYFMLNV
ncbi:uncharacterized protein [Diadema antillarum]|uniref:uncharacterized protein n=1 Tax=Diadema antillarum TaxID=105358 RepID=UPI003A83617F